MELSKRTLSILSNFSNINQSILINEGSMLRTISASKNILAKANIDESFDKEIAIYDLGKFLGVLKLYEEREFDFKDEYVVIRNKNNQKQYTRFFYSSPATVVAPPRDKDVDFDDEPIVSFTLSQKDFQNIVKGSSIMTLPDVVIQGTQNEPVLISGEDTENSAMGSLNQELEEIAQSDFSFKIAVEHLTKLMPGSYEVALSENGIAQFTNTTYDVIYFIAVSIDEDEELDDDEDDE